MGKTIYDGLDGFINISNILFDDKLKDFLDKMREECKDVYYKLEMAVSPNSIERCQETLRDYIDAHSDEFNYGENKQIINQEYFAVIVASVCEYRDKASYDECYKNSFEVIECNNNATVGEDGDITITDDINHCVCSHYAWSVNSYLLQHCTTRYTLFIGSECIKKNKLLSADEFEKMKEISKKRKAAVKLTKGEINETEYNELINKGKCEKCKRPHRNKKDNLCNECREITCIRCKGTRNRRYKLCFHCYMGAERGKCSRCGDTCDPKYTECFHCYNGATKGICVGCDKKCDPKYLSCYTCKMNTY